jgi:cobalt-precorrin 5A hydrolase
VVVGEAVIVAGIGCRRGVAAGDVIAAVEAALARCGLAADRLAALATIRLKRDEPGILAAAQQLALALMIIEDEALQRASGRTLTSSVKSMAAAATPSVSEAAALAAAGEGSRLLAPRLILGAVTCAIAIQGNAS